MRHEFEQSGIHLEDENRQTLINQMDLIKELEMKFQMLALHPDPIRYAVPHSHLVYALVIFIYAIVMLFFSLIH
jgi:hypothetical protein